MEDIKKCPTCGGTMTFTGTVYESMPPQYEYRCCICGLEELVKEEPTEEREVEGPKRKVRLTKYKSLNTKIILLILLFKLALGSITAQTKRDSSSILARQADKAHIKADSFRKALGLLHDKSDLGRSLMLQDSIYTYDKLSYILINKAVDKLLNKPQ